MVFPVKNYVGLGLFIVTDIVSFGHQNETQNREMCREAEKVGMQLPEKSASAKNLIGHWL